MVNGVCERCLCAFSIKNYKEGEFNTCPNCHLHTDNLNGKINHPRRLKAFRSRVTKAFNKIKGIKGSTKKEIESITNTAHWLKSRVKSKELKKLCDTIIYDLKLSVLFAGSCAGSDAKKQLELNVDKMKEIISIKGIT